MVAFSYYRDAYGLLLAVPTYVPNPGEPPVQSYYWAHTAWQNGGHAHWAPYPAQPAWAPPPPPVHPLAPAPIVPVGVAAPQPQYQHAPVQAVGAPAQGQVVAQPAAQPGAQPGAQRETLEKLIELEAAAQATVLCARRALHAALPPVAAPPAQNAAAAQLQPAPAAAVPAAAAAAPPYAHFVELDKAPAQQPVVRNEAGPARRREDAPVRAGKPYERPAEATGGARSRGVAPQPQKQAARAQAPARNEHHYLKEEPKEEPK